MMIQLQSSRAISIFDRRVKLEQQCALGTDELLIYRLYQMIRYARLTHNVYLTEDDLDMLGPAISERDTRGALAYRPIPLDEKGAET